MATKKRTDEPGIAIIKPANMVILTLPIVGTAPLVQEAFSHKTKEELMRKMAETKAERGSKKAKDARPPRDYDAEFKGAQHRSAEGWPGIPAGAFRRAMVDACRTANLVMTTTKLALFVRADGLDAVDATPLVRLIGGEPARIDLAVRNENGSVDIRVRPIWREWSANVQIEFDADMITAESIVNLLDRAGRQVGIGAGRPFSKKSTGMGWGTFTVAADAKEQVA